ncbi:uncharacterized protein ARMOST_20697 [Armillaria ostoyae]|uniref:Uncharacterized protein n=1 Tax=Armillaria ostoyae TaxID=47428 RepID=A0A284S841_ARMOS|nr:uncharacterized protein ARMOST_20697 [Armillaria ostoyae]
MPSQEVTLPSFDKLLHSLVRPSAYYDSRVLYSHISTCRMVRIPPPLFGSRVQPSAGPTPPPANNHHSSSQPGNCVQPNAEPAPPPIITWLKQALGVVHENRVSPVFLYQTLRPIGITQPLGHGYSVPKPSETWPPPHEKHDCSDFGCCSFLNRWSPFPRTYVDRLKTQGKSYTVYLHRPKWDERTSLPVLKNIPFISNDPSDKALGLPGVSVTRLLAMEPGILADSNSVILNAQSLWPTRAWSPQVRVNTL